MLKFVNVGLFFLSLILLSQPGLAKSYEHEAGFYKPFNHSSKVVVMKTLDEMGVRYEVDEDGDLVFTMNDKGWIGYVIFSYAAGTRHLWNVQVRTQFATKSSYYEELLEFANGWNSTQKVPKVAMKNRSKMVLSINYPIQYGFNSEEFKHNIFNMFNREAEKIGNQINPMRR